MPEGKNYWIIAWTKNIIYIHNTPYKYITENNKMYVTITDPIDESEIKIAVYQKIDNKKYNLNDIKHKDDTNISFESDKKLIGTWKTVDHIKDKDSFNPKHIQNKNRFLQSLVCTSEGDVFAKYSNSEKAVQTKYTKNYIIDLCFKETLSKYFYQTIEGEEYLIVEFKNGDYVYGGLIMNYYVLKKEKN